MLQTILNEIALQDGEDLTNEATRSLLVSRVNRAAREIHNETDLEEAMEERVFDLNRDSQQVALPFFVSQVRGARYEGTYNAIDVSDQQNRYNKHVGDEAWPLDIRRKGFSTIERNISNESLITASIPKEEAEAIVITIVGATENAQRVKEDITIPAGSTEALGLVNFKEPIYSITKTAPTEQDVTLKDVENNIIAVIPNWSDFVNYRLYQIYESPNGSTLTSQDAIEVRFKWQYFTVRDDTDLFWGTTKYDDAILYKYLALYSASDKVRKAHERQCQKLLADLARDEKIGTKKRLNLVPSGLLHPTYVRRDRAHRYW